MHKKIHRYWKKTPAILRKPSVFIVGWVIVVVGIILIPLPGPGWAIVFLGFAILATEFASAKRTHQWLVAQLNRIINWLRRLYYVVTKKQ